MLTDFYLFYMGWQENILSWLRNNSVLTGNFFFVPTWAFPPPPLQKCVKKLLASWSKDLLGRIAWNLTELYCNWWERTFFRSIKYALKIGGPEIIWNWVKKTFFNILFFRYGLIGCFVLTPKTLFCFHRKNVRALRLVPPPPQKFDKKSLASWSKDLLGRTAWKLAELYYKWWQRIFFF